MIRCAVCEAPLLDADVKNTDISIHITCSCAHVMVLSGFGENLSCSSYEPWRHPDFVKGDDEQRYQELARSLRLLDPEVLRLTELAHSIKREKDRLWKTVQHTLVNRHQAETVIEGLGRDRVAEKLREMFTEEQLAEMLAQLSTK